MAKRFPLSLAVSVALAGVFGASASYWALQLWVPASPTAPASPVAHRAASVDLSAARRLFASSAAPAQAAAPAGLPGLKVLGVIESGPRGVALISVDGKPSRAYAVGEDIAEGLRLEAVSIQRVRVSLNGRPHELDTPTRSSLDVLTQASDPGGSTAQPARPPRP